MDIIFYLVSKNWIPRKFVRFFSGAIGVVATIRPEVVFWEGAGTLFSVFFYRDFVSWLAFLVITGAVAEWMGAGGGARGSRRGPLRRPTRVTRDHRGLQLGFVFTRISHTRELCVSPFSNPFSTSQ